MKRPPFIIRYLIVGSILVFPPILSTHFGTIYLGKDNGVLLGFCVGILIITFCNLTLLYLGPFVLLDILLPIV